MLLAVCAVMNRTSPSKRAFRASVVSVTAAFAPVAGGCLSETISNPPGACDSPSGCVPEVDAGEQCPSITRPIAGSPCESAPPAGCLYGLESAFCRDGRWELEGAKSDGGAGEGGAHEGCPVQAPSEGSDCSAPTSLSCEYDLCYGAHPTRTALCEAGKWTVLQTSCNPPYVECPSEQPEPDTACEAGFGNGICSYGACAEGGSAVTLECRENQWVTTGECPSACPSAAPANGALCWHVGDPCRYGDCYGAPTISADCREGKWQVAEATCNPPPPEL